jgi:hypothetical protein
VADKIMVSAKSIAEKLDKSDLTDDEKAALANLLAAGLQAGSEVEGFLLGSSVGVENYNSWWGSYTGADANVAGNYIGAGQWRSGGYQGTGVGTFVPLLNQYAGASFVSGPGYSGLGIGT